MLTILIICGIVGWTLPTLTEKPLTIDQARSILLNEDPATTKHPRYAEALDCVTPEESYHLRPIYSKRKDINHG